MRLKELYEIWKDSDFKDKDMQKAFERAISTSSVIALIKENQEE